MFRLSNILVLVLLTSCGVYVGNPKQPDEGETLHAPSDDSLAALAAEGINDLLSASNASINTQDSTYSLMTQENSFKVQCVDQESGAQVTRVIKLQTEVERGIRPAAKRIIASAFEHDATLTYQSTDQQIVCGLNDRVQVPWNTINNLTISRNFTNKKSRSTSQKSDGSLISEFIVNTSGENTVEFNKEQSGSTLTLQETHSYLLAKSFEYTKGQVRESYSFTSKSDPDNPLLVTRVRENGALASFTIDAGILQQQLSTGHQMSLTYQGLAFNTSSCLPISGSLVIEFKMGDQTQQYQLLVENGELVFKGENTNIVVDLDPCQLR